MSEDLSLILEEPHEQDWQPSMQQTDWPQHGTRSLLIHSRPMSGPWPLMRPRYLLVVVLPAQVASLGSTLHVSAWLPDWLLHGRPIQMPVVTLKTSHFQERLCL